MGWMRWKQSSRPSQGKTAMGCAELACWSPSHSSHPFVFSRLFRGSDGVARSTPFHSLSHPIGGRLMVLAYCTLCQFVSLHRHWLCCTSCLSHVSYSTYLIGHRLSRESWHGWMPLSLSFYSSALEKFGPGVCKSQCVRPHCDPFRFDFLLDVGRV